MIWRRTDLQAAATIEECEAFLAGRCAEVWAARGEPVPVWAWMNLLAHGTEDEVRAASRAPRSRDGWRQARAYVAREIIELVDAGRTSLPELQRSVLVPLELDVMSCRTAGQWTPGQLAGGLLGVLPSWLPRGRRRAGDGTSA